MCAFRAITAQGMVQHACTDVMALAHIRPASHADAVQEMQDVPTAICAGMQNLPPLIAEKKTLLSVYIFPFLVALQLLMLLLALMLMAMMMLTIISQGIVAACLNQKHMRLHCEVCSGASPA